MTKKRKGGWHGESRRHSLARKGIKTGQKSAHKQSIKKPKVGRITKKSRPAGLSEAGYNEMVRDLQEFLNVDRKKAKRVLEDEVIPEMLSEGVPINAEGMTEIIQMW